MLIFGLMYSNNIFFFISIFGKIGYFPFHFLYIPFRLCSSYMFLIYDVFPKLAYFNSVSSVIATRLVVNRSPCGVIGVALINAIDYLSIIESYLFLCYISSLQLSMVPFSFSNDLIITFPNRDLIGLISYLLINFWSSKVSCYFLPVAALILGIK